MTVQLTYAHGNLQMPSRLKNGQSSYICYHYMAGDYDFIPWPLRSHEWKGRLARALYDARETGELENVPFVLLPNGLVFEIEANLHLYRDPNRGAAL